MSAAKKRRFDKKIISPEHHAIKALRIEVGFTLKEAGKRLEISEKTIGAIENGRISLGKNRIEEILKAYGLTYLDFERARRLIIKEGPKKHKRQFIRTVLKNSDRRSYQKIITKECKVLRSMRRMKKISQDEASRLCGYSRATIGHIENGRIELTKDRIQCILRAYNYKYTEFEKYLGNREISDNIIEYCIKKVWQLEDSKLSIIKTLLENI